MKPGASSRPWQRFAPSSAKGPIKNVQALLAIFRFPVLRESLVGFMRFAVKDSGLPQPVNP